MSNPKNFVEDQFPRSSWGKLPTIYRTAYKAADELVSANPLFQVQSCLSNKGRIVAWAVDFGLERAIKNGTISCDYSWSQFARPTGRYLRLRFSHSTASVSQVANPNQQPRSVVFRENARLGNQQLLPFPELLHEAQIQGEPHFLLLHGYKTLDFAHIGVPSGESPRELSWISPNLMDMPHEVENDAGYALPEDTDFNLDELNLLKEDIERWRKDNGV